MSDGYDLFAAVTGEEPATAEGSVAAETEALEESAPLEPQQEAVEEVAATEPQSAPVQQTAPEPQAPNWDDPNANPHLQDAQWARNLRAAVAEAKRVKEQSAIVETIDELSDGDQARFQQIQKVVAQYAAPIAQQARQFEHRANSAEKTLAALWITAKANLPEDQLNQLTGQMEELMVLEGAEVMERTAFGKQAMNRQFQEALAAKETELDTLRQQLVAQNGNAQRDANGADLVDGGTGQALSGDWETDARNATNMDDYFAAYARRSA